MQSVISAYVLIVVARIVIWYKYHYKKPSGIFKFDLNVVDFCVLFLFDFLIFLLEL